MQLKHAFLNQLEKKKRLDRILDIERIKQMSGNFGDNNS